LNREWVRLLDLLQMKVRCERAAVFGQIAVMRRFRDSGFLTQICGNNFMVLKLLRHWW
jgi:hypothetical protein